MGLDAALIMLSDPSGFAMPSIGADSAVDVERQHVARLHRQAVHMHDAGTALGGVATDVRAGQPQVLAKEVHQSGSPALHRTPDGR